MNMTPQLAYEKLKSIGTVDSMIINESHHWFDGKCTKKWSITAFDGMELLAFTENVSLKEAVQIIGNAVRGNKPIK